VNVVDGVQENSVERSVAWAPDGLDFNDLLRSDGLHVVEGRVFAVQYSDRCIFFHRPVPLAEVERIAEDGISLRQSAACALIVDRCDAAQPLEQLSAEIDRQLMQPASHTAASRRRAAGPRVVIENPAAAPETGHSRPIDARFVLPPDLDVLFAENGATVRASPPSERLEAFERFARVAAGCIGSRLPQVECVDRLQAFAQACGLAASHGDDAIQELLARALASPLAKEGDEPLDDGEDERLPEFSDEALALRFAEHHANDLRYVAVWGKWLWFVGTHWRADDTLRTFDAARRLCRTAAATCIKEKTAVAIASAKTVAAVERLARADRRLALRVDDLDADPWALNTPAGVIDLRTSKIRAHRASDLFTKITSVAPDPKCAISTWRNFLLRVTNDNEELIGFLRRMLGYALTGLIREHALFFLYGTGANGKSTFLNVLIGCLLDFHRTAAIETFTASTSERHPTDLAALRGARAVTAVETEEGRRWAESKIKSLTGGDRIAARFMRQDFFEFLPTFKLVIAGNHMPSLRSVDEAIRRRFHLIPFTVTVPLAERDEKLGEKLKAEWPGILAWMIEGCLEWQRVGLSPPEIVRSATANYLEAEDALGAWIELAGSRDANAFETTEALFRSWKNYASRAGEYVGSVRKFSQRLEEREATLGLRKGRNAVGHRGFYGFQLWLAADAGEPARPSADGDEARS
jgi:putative DNA primase/helicase